MTGFRRFFTPTNTRSTYLAPYYFSNFRKRPLTYYRETNDTSILTQATADVRNGNVSASSAFIAENAFVITWISTRNKFQVVLATDGNNTTYAILNYREIGEMSTSSVEINEVGCGFRRLYNNRNPAFISNLIRGGTVRGVRGRHVFRLSTPDCFKRFTGLRTIKFSQYFSAPPNIRQFSENNLNLFKLNEITSDVSVLLMEVYSTSPGQLVTCNTNTRLQQSHSDNQYRYTYSIFKASNINRQSSSSRRSFTVAMIVTNDTLKTPDFQYGLVDIPTVLSDTKCTSVVFTEEMRNTPSVKITAHVGSTRNGESYKLVYAWLRAVTTKVGIYYFYISVYFLYCQRLSSMQQP